MKYVYFILGIIFINTVINCDIIYLKNGNRIEGEIIKITKDEIIIKVAFGKLYINRNNVKKYLKEDKVDNIIYQGDRLLKLGAIKHAVRFYKKYWRKYKKNRAFMSALINAFIYAGEYYIRKNQLNKAKECFLELKRIASYVNIKKYLDKIKKREKWGYEELKLADLFAKQKKYKKALKKYKFLLKSFPQWEKVLLPRLAFVCVRLGNKYYFSKDIYNAKSYYNLALEYNPDIFPAIERRWININTQWVIDNYFKKNKWKEAETYLNNILKISPTSREILYLLGITLENQKKFSIAYNIYSKIANQYKRWNGDFKEYFKLKNIAFKKLKSPFLEGGIYDSPNNNPPTGKWEQVTTKHFIIFHQNRFIGSRVANTLEYHWYSIQQRLAPPNWNGKWQKKCKVYVFPNKRMLLKALNVPKWSGGWTKMSYSHGRLKFAIIYVAQNMYQLFSSILPHELTHAMYPWFMNYKKYLPLWLNEGIAISSEAPFSLRNRLKIVRLAVRNDKIFPLNKLFTMKKYPLDKIDIFYAESYSIVKFLLSLGGSESLLKFSLRINSSLKNVERCLNDIYGVSDLSSFKKEWLKYIFSLK